MPTPISTRTVMLLTGGPGEGCRDAAWTVRAVGDLSRVPAAVRGLVVAASVPGCVHTDLMGAGLIADPAVGMNEAECQWVSWTDWRYERAFEAGAEFLGHERVGLVFESLDTIARVELNGVRVGEAASEFLPYRFDVRGVLRAGANRLSVTFKSPLRHVREEEARLGARPVNGDWDPFVFVRKCASNFRWDWGPRVATCGISGGAWVEAWSGPSLEDVSVGVEEVSAAVAVVRVRARVVGGAGNEWVEVRAALGSRECAKRKVPVVGGVLDATLTIARPELWHPVGAGSQPLYDVGVSVLSDDGSARVLDRVVRCVGLRSCAWRDGVLHVNGRAEFCRGANWIPEGLWPRDRTAARVGERLEQVVSAGMNMLRVWGGGRYEPGWFYEMCDEMGIMVWQDFMFSCACYPEEEPLRSLVEAEARHQVDRLRHHPSIVLWCGGNECVWAHESWGFKEKLAESSGESKSWGSGYYFDLLPRMCAELDSSRPYLANSPWSAAGVPANDARVGDRHTWDVWGDGYREVVPRFCSEFGQQSPSDLATLREAGLVPDATSVSAGADGAGGAGSLVPAALVARQLGPGGMERWYDGPLAKMFRAPRSFEEWHYLAQLLQARSMATGIEWMRANWPLCAGALVWQMNDAWPGFSWSLVDSAGREKPAFHAVKRSNAARLVTVQPMDGVLTVVAVNDGADGWECGFKARRVGFDGSVLSGSGARRAAVAPRSVARLCAVEAAVGVAVDPRRELVVVDSDAGRATWYWLDDRELVYPEPRAEGAMLPRRSGPGGFGLGVEITARSLIRDPWLNLEVLLPGKIARGAMLGTMLPGETRRFEVADFRGGDGGDFGVRVGSGGLMGPPVLWCANRFGAGRT